MFIVTIIKQNGRHGLAGRKKLADRKRALAVDLYRQKKHSIGEICRTVGITKPTLYAYVRQAEGEKVG